MSADNFVMIRSVQNVEGLQGALVAREQSAECMLGLDCQRLALFQMKILDLPDPEPKKNGEIFGSTDHGSLLAAVHGGGLLSSLQICWPLRADSLKQR